MRLDGHNQELHPDEALTLADARTPVVLGATLQVPELARGLFFTDLSTLLTQPWAEENALADTLMMEASDAMAEAGGPPLIVLGWHSYCKDYEHTFITMASKHAARNHGLNTNPNLSFMSQLPLPPGFEFKNRPPPQPTPQPPLPAVAMTFVQTDGATCASGRRSAASPRCSRSCRRISRS